MRHQADVGPGRRVAEHELARFGSAIASKRRQTFADPVRYQLSTSSCELAELVLEIFEHAQIIERVDVAGDRHRHRDDMRAFGRRGGDQGLVGIAESR